ncbi:hypothetical protein ACCC97_10615 [Variovorax sp. Varisp85]|uniref:hypothetical protein n=1 Tax=Variovorax sp. Varisp85 TaxID=3243059 RepID=UPI0039A556C5
MRTFEKLLAVVAMLVVAGGAAAGAQAADSSAVAGRASDWPRLPTYQPPEKAAHDAWLAGVLAESTRQLVEAEGTRGASVAQTEASIAQDQQVQARKDAATLGAALKTVANDSRLPVGADRLADSDKRDKGVRPDYYLQNMDKIEAGIGSDEERQFLRENVRGPESLAWARRELELRRRADQVYTDAGPVTTFFAKAAARLFDPLTWVLLAVSAFFLVHLIRKKGKGQKAELSPRREPAFGLPSKEEGQKG